MAYSHKDLNPADKKAEENLRTKSESEKTHAESNNVSHKTAAPIHYDPKAKGEVMPVSFPNGLPQLVLDSLGTDVITNWPGDKKTKKFSIKKRQQFKLFGRNIQDLLRPQATLVATYILGGEEKEVETALALVKEHPDILHCRVVARDRLGRTVEGTPLQIGAMAGDVDLQEKIEEETNRGMVERLALAGKLSQTEVAEQLEVITGEEARQQNKQRNLRVLTAIARFGEGICEVRQGWSFEAFQTRCQPLIDQLEKDLQPDTNEVITSGYIFDPHILYYAAMWFEENVHLRFGDWGNFQSDVFWINGFGKLQAKLSSRDAQIARAGIGILVDDKEIPQRRLNNSDGSCYFYNSSSYLGQYFYLGSRLGPAGGASRPAGWGRWRTPSSIFGKLMSSKNNSIAKLMQRPADTCCLIM